MEMLNQKVLGIKMKWILVILAIVLVLAGHYMGLYKLPFL